MTISISSDSLLGSPTPLRSEHASNVLGLRRAGVIGLIAWPLFGLSDWFIVSFVQTGRLWVYLLLRGLGLLVIGAMLVRLYRKPLPSRATLRVMDVTGFALTSALVSLSCVEFRGIASPLALGVVTILVCRTAVLPDRWDRALLPVGLTAAVHPVTLLVVSFFSAEIASQLRDAEMLAAFLLNQIFVFGAAAIVLAGCHSVWALRRQVYAARTFGRYRLRHRIGKGGMGEVWAAHHSGLNRDVAIKILRPDRMDELAVARFEREVRMTSELCHPNTVRVFDFGVTEDGLCYYAMELLTGEDLASIVKRGGPLRLDRSMYIVWQASKALAEAHGRGIVHRDIKPQNIFITSAGPERDVVKVVDFGLARVTESDDPALTYEGWAVGTPAYLAPEVVSGRQADARSDIYALGGVLYFALCGRPPFQGADARAVLIAQVRETPQPPSRVLGREVPAAVERLVLRCLEKNPDRRPQSAAELAEAIMGAAGAVVSGWSSSQPPTGNGPSVSGVVRTERVGTGPGAQDAVETALELPTIARK